MVKYINFTIIVCIIADDVTSDCGRNYTEKDGVIYSPAYPGYFMGLDQCEWRITVPIQYRIFLKSTYFYVYRDPDHRGSKIGVEVGKCTKRVAKQFSMFRVSVPCKVE